MTLPELVRAQTSPLAQFEIMQRADLHLFKGRYSAAQLTPHELTLFDLKKESK